MNPAREFVAMPDRCPGQISWDYDRTEIMADGVVHAIGVCLGLIAQLITELCRLPRSPFLNHPGPDEIRKRKVRRFIVLTDLIGSGRRARDYLEAAWQVRSVRSWSSLRLLRFEVLAYATTDHGRRRVDHDNLEAQDAARSVLAGGMLAFRPAGRARRAPRPMMTRGFDRWA
jgi:hypothetical protein